MITPVTTSSPGRPPGEASTGAGEPLLLTDLLLTGRELADLLVRAVRSTDPLDAFLLAAGLNQLAEDRLHADPLILRRAATYLARQRGPLPGAASRAAACAASGLAVVARTGRTARALQRRQEAFATCVGTLADHVMSRCGSTGSALGAVTAAGLELAGHLGDDIVRLPACFRDFDQHPADVERLMQAYAARWPTLSRPTAVVGLRTSGSYLAPLAGAALRAAGFSDVCTLTFRPGRPFLPAERERLAAVAGAQGRIVLIDDPPGTGETMQAAARAVERVGVSRSSISLAVPLLDDEDGVPARLQPWDHVLLPWSRWSVHERLTEESVSTTLHDLLPGHQHLVAVRRTGTSSGGRGHASAEFAARLVDQRDNRRYEQPIVVEGAGTGYFGRHALAVAARLQGRVPQVYGVREGLLYMDGPRQRVDADPQAELPLGLVVDAAIDYVRERQLSLPVERDRTGSLAGRDPVWEVAARLLSRMYGPLAPVAQVAVLNRLSRGLLSVSRPCVIDGATDLRRWAPDPEAGGLRKGSFHQGAFSRLELFCYDPAFDVAGAAMPPHAAAGSRVRAAFEARTGQHIDPERWLLYQLVQLGRLGRIGELPARTVVRHQGDALNAYLASVLLSDVAPSASGPLCAVDLDGVLESDPTGITASTPAGVLAIRALTLHGYRPVLATGRSLPEVVERCSTFGLAGGVAEYGTVVYRHCDGSSVDLRTPQARAALDRVRAHLRADPDARLDEDYRYVVRAQRIDADGCPGPLPHGLTADLVHSAGEAPLRLIHGQRQTDIVSPSDDKGRALLALSRRLGAQPSPRPYVLAVGDSEPDLAMFSTSRCSRAPRNAARAVRAAGIRVVRRSYQAGLLDACSALLGHRPGDCAVCRAPELPARSRAMVAALGVREAGLSGLGPRTVRLLVQARGAAAS